mgnify:FL=1
MKTNFLKTLGISLALTTTTACAHETSSVDQTASYIEMTAAEGQTQNLAEFLTGAAPIVGQTEPGTQLWFALKSTDGTLAIFDIFDDENARNAHFSGAVASALNESAGTLVEGGWDDGVVANINNSTVLSTKAPVDLYSATTATYIKLNAAPGQSDALAELLSAAGPIVAETEPKTLYWVALRLDENSFAIFDIFADDSGRADHFAGQVAGLLKEKSAVLVEGGWDAGVVANVNNYEILAIK